MHLSVLCSTIYNSQIMETTKCLHVFKKKTTTILHWSIADNIKQAEHQRIDAFELWC